MDRSDSLAKSDDDKLMLPPIKRNVSVDSAAPLRLGPVCALELMETNYAMQRVEACTDAVVVFIICRV